MNHLPTVDVPTFCDSDKLKVYLLYLDDLRESGAVNMFGARDWPQSEFSEELTSNQARQVLLYWMKTFSERHPKA